MSGYPAESPYSRMANSYFNNNTYNPNLTSIAEQKLNMQDFGAATPFSRSQQQFSTPTTQPSWLSQNMGNISMGVGAAKDLANMYFGMEQLGLAKKQLGMTKDIANANLYNQATTYNNALQNKADTLAFVNQGNVNKGIMTPEQAQAVANDYYNSRKLEQKTV